MNSIRPVRSIGLASVRALSVPLPARAAVIGPDDTRVLEHGALGRPGYDIPGRASSKLDGPIAISRDRLAVEPIGAVPEPGPVSPWRGALLALGAVARRRHAGVGKSATSP